MNKTIIAMTLASVALSGCATRASSVTPVAIAASDYAGLSCEEARTALFAAMQNETQLAEKQDTAAAIDAAGVLVAFIPVGSLLGGNVKGELAQAKGEKLALERHVRQTCAPQAAAAPAPASGPTAEASAPQ